MKTADKNKLRITDIRGSWAGAMGHFQFIPTTLAQYGMDGNNDGKIDIINSIGDAMYSAGNYLNKLGWNKNERIVRRVALPADFDISMLNGDVKKTLPEWSYLGVTNVDGSPIPQTDMIAGLVADTKSIVRNELFHDDAQSDADFDVAPKSVIYAYLTYPNFYRIKKWNNSSWYAIAIAELSDKLK
jgi:membrane-bound lytic murein transglycosylase B